MAQHTHHVEHDSGTSTATGMIVGILAVLVMALIVLFFVFGGPARFSGAPTAPAPSGQTNVNVPSQGQPQSGPNINVPRQIDVNVNQPPQQQAPAAPQAPAGGQAPSNP